jgi:CRISPR system Cascade subunit CasB
MKVPLKKSNKRCKEVFMPEIESSIPIIKSDVKNDERKLLYSIVGRLAHVVDKILGNGEVADLRRLRPEDPACPEFWKVMAEYWDMPYDNDEARKRACLLSGLARTKGLHDFHASLGKALVDAGYSELRFVRLLRAQDRGLFKEIELMAEFLSSKSQTANWTQAAELLFTKDDENAESLRRRIARDYYGNQNKKKEK